jgi:hypothetical protein
MRPRRKPLNRTDKARGWLSTTVVFYGLTILAVVIAVLVKEWRAGGGR